MPPKSRCAIWLNKPTKRTFWSERGILSWMKKLEKTLVILLLSTTLFKGIMWAASIPIWHGPDEQAHFAQVQYYAEVRKGLSAEDDLSLEVFESERLLGTLRDETGANNFTYHPEYRIEYAQTTTGIFEKLFDYAPREARTTFMKREAARYPPLFYIISALGYFAGYGGNLFARVALTRIISVFFAVATIWASYKLSRAIFPRSFLLSLSIASLVSFQPMFTFLSSGVNNDNLLNLFTTLLLWLMVDAMRKGLTMKHTVAMGAVLGLGILTKQLMYPFIPLPIAVFLYEGLKKKKLKNMGPRLIVFLTASILLGGIVFMREWVKSGVLPYWPQVSPESPLYSLSIVQYLSQKLPQLYRETLPWYFGVFNWLGVVLPLPVLRAIKLGLLFSVIGLCKYVIGKLSTKKLEVVDWQLGLLLFSGLWYTLWVLIWDYMLVRSIGFSHGIQGRNFFPNLAGHMTLIAFGLWSLNEKYKEKIMKAAVIAVVLLNFIALKTMLGSYYQLLPLRTLVIQASQYKPWFFKGIGLILWFILYLAFLGRFLAKYIATGKERE